MSRVAVSLLLVCTLFCAVGLFAQATSPGTPPPQNQPSASAPPATSPEPSAKDEAQRTLNNLGPQLNLTADQKTKLEPILTNEIQQVRDLRANTSMSVQQKQAAFQQTLTADHTKIDAILTPEQKAKLAQLHQQEESGQGQAQPPAPGPQPAQPPPTGQQPPK